LAEQITAHIVEFLEDKLCKEVQFNLVAIKLLLATMLMILQKQFS